jgi:hypothetical protein
MRAVAAISKREVKLQFGEFVAVSGEKDRY